VVHLLVGKGAVVLENVVVLRTSGIDNLLEDGLPGDDLLARDGHRHQQGLSMRERTRISLSWSSGISASFAPWYLGMTSWGPWLARYLRVQRRG
jgi:hypothetical protein